MNKIYFMSMILIAGCSSIESIPTQNYSKTPLNGFPYHLTSTDLTIKVNRQLQNCNNGTLTFKTTFEVKPTELIDEKHSYVIDPMKLQSWIKSTSLKLEYHPNGNLKTINAEAEDMTGELITAIAGTAVKFVSGWAPGGADANNKVKVINLCNAATQSMLDSVKDSKAELKKAAVALSTESDKVTFWLQKKKAAGKFWTSEQSKQFIEAIDKAQNAKLEQEKLSRRVDESVEKLTLTHSTTLSSKNTPDWFRTPIDEITFEEIDKKIWLSEEGESIVKRERCKNEVVPKEPQSEKPGEINPKDAKDKLPKCLFGYSVMMAVSNADATQIKELFEEVGSNTTETPKTAKPPKKPVPPTDGFVFRAPQLSTINFVKGKRSADATYTPGDAIDSTQVTISQLANIRIIPFKSYPFSKIKFSAAFTESGALTSIGSESTSAVPKVTSTLDALVSKAGEIKKIKAEQPLNDLKSETALLKAQKDLEDAKKLLAAKTDDENALAALKGSTAMYEAELANIKAEKALKDATAESKQNE